MALYNYSGGERRVYNSYAHHTPSISPRYTLDSRHALMSQWIEGRRLMEERTETNSDFAIAGGAAALGLAAAALHRNKSKTKKKKGRSMKRRELKTGEGKNNESVEEVSVNCGDEATLSCSAPRPDSVDGLEWTRADLEDYVYLYKDGEADLTEQHQDYRGRCDLKDGTASLLLKNVSRADSGIYECRFIKHSAGLRKRAIINNNPVSVVRLRVRKTGTCAAASDETHPTAGGNKRERFTEGTMRHHYVAFGVAGVFGLTAALFFIIMAL